MLNYSSRKGLMTELRCQLAFTDIGILVSQPIINDSRYDFIVDINDVLYKIQCKSSTPVDETEDAFIFAVSNKNWNNGDKKSYKDQIDFFFTTFDDVNYLIPIDDVGTTNKTLRLRSKVNDPSISWAKDYEFLTVVTTKLNYKLPDTIWQDNRKNPYKEQIQSKTINKCIDCGNLVFSGAIRCLDCYKRIKTENSINIDREVLKMKIRTMPFTSIGKEYNVTDNAIRKWCDKYNLPRKKNDIKSFSDEEWELI